MLRTTSLDGVTVSYDRYGSGPPLLLVHGAFSDQRTNWELVKPMFEERFTVHAMARRGRGETDTRNTKEVWVYDMRANMPAFGKRTPFTRDYFRTPPDAPASQPRDRFEDVFGSDPRGGPAALVARQDAGEAGRWRRFTHEQIAQKRGTTKRTVANQVASIFRKADVGSLVELAALVHRTRQEKG